MGKNKKPDNVHVTGSLSKRIHVLELWWNSRNIFPKHFHEEWDVIVGFLLGEKMSVNLFVNFWFSFCLFQLSILMICCQDEQLIDLMLLSFQPSKSTVGWFGFWPSALYSEMFSNVLIIPRLCQVCFKWKSEDENRES